MATVEEPPKVVGAQLTKKPRTWSGPIAVLGVILVYACMLAAHGNGWSPLVWVAIGLFGTPFLAWVLRRWMNPWLGRLIALVFVCGLSFALAKISTRIDKNQAYSEIFGSRPPAGVTTLQARKQWYDGIDYVVAFQSNRAGVEAMLAQKEFKDESYQDQAILRRLTVVPFLDMSTLWPTTFTSTNSWYLMTSVPPARWTSIRIFWNETTGRGVIIGEWH
jgi:hypothetical protein